MRGLLRPVILNAGLTVSTTPVTAKRPNMEERMNPCQSTHSIAAALAPDVASLQDKAKRLFIRRPCHPRVIFHAYRGVTMSCVGEKCDSSKGIRGVMLNQSAISMRFGRMQSKRFLRGKDHAIFLARPWLNRRLVRIQFGRRIILLKLGFNTFLPYQILRYRTLIRQAGCFCTLEEPPAIGLPVQLTTTNLPTVHPEKATWRGHRIGTAKPGMCARSSSKSLGRHKDHEASSTAPMDNYAQASWQSVGG